MNETNSNHSSEESLREKMEAEKKYFKKKRGFQGFPIWVWLVLLVVVAGLYFGLTMYSAR